MGRPAYGGRATCEPCMSIDVRRWHQQGRLHPSQHFYWSWTRGGELAGSISVCTEMDAVVLIYLSRSWGGSEWKSVEQRVLITWTACHLGGQRPWFVCSVSHQGRFCGRRAAVLYGASELFACRLCYGLAYASQQETAMHRWIGQAQEIRMKLGGSANLCESFPEKPKRMHWRTYLKLRARAEAAEAHSNVLTMHWLNRLDHRRG